MIMDTDTMHHWGKLGHCKHWWQSGALAELGLESSHHGGIRQALNLVEYWRWIFCWRLMMACSGTRSISSTIYIPRKSRSHMPLSIVFLRIAIITFLFMSLFRKHISPCLNAPVSSLAIPRDVSEVQPIQTKRTYVLNRLDSNCNPLSLSAASLARSNACVLPSSLCLVTSS